MMPACHVAETILGYILQALSCNTVDKFKQEAPISSPSLLNKYPLPTHLSHCTLDVGKLNAKKKQLYQKKLTKLALRKKNGMRKLDKALIPS